MRAAAARDRGRGRGPAGTNRRGRVRRTRRELGGSHGAVSLHPSGGRSDRWERTPGTAKRPKPNGLRVPESRSRCRQDVAQTAARSGPRHRVTCAAEATARQGLREPRLWARPLTRYPSWLERGGREAAGAQGRGLGRGPPKAGGSPCASARSPAADRTPERASSPEREAHRRPDGAGGTGAPTGWRRAPEAGRKAAQARSDDPPPMGPATEGRCEHRGPGASRGERAAKRAP